MGVKSRETQERHREVGFERSVEQTREPMNKNRIRGVHGWTSEPPIAKSIPIKSPVRISGGCARKAIELTPGDLRPVSQETERTERGAEREAGVSRGHIRSAIVLTEGPNGARSEEERVNDRQVGSLVS